MNKLTPQDLKSIKEKIKGTLYVSEGDSKVKVTVHMGTCGISAGAIPVMETLQKEVDANPNAGIMLTSSGCPGLCSQEPMITVEQKGQEPVKYIYVDADKAKTIFNEHILGGSVVAKLALAAGREVEA
jgi:NADP-reducing hydrogenase subunit HndB